MKKYIRINLDDSNKIECPICHRMNNHTTGDVCEHAYKVVINNHKESVAWYKNS